MMVQFNCRLSLGGVGFSTLKPVGIKVYEITVLDHTLFVPAYVVSSVISRVSTGHCVFSSFSHFSDVTWCVRRKKHRRDFSRITALAEDFSV